MDIVRARVREVAQRAGLGEVPAGTLAIGAAVALVVLCVALWQWWPGRGEAGPAAGSAHGGTASALASAGVTTQAQGSSAVLESQGGATADRSESSKLTLLVHVVGAVRHPGVYSLDEGARVRDAVDAAGGLLGSAAQASVNLARPVADGEQIYVPTQDEAEKGIGYGGGGPGVQPPAGAAGGPSGSAAGPSTPININTADATLLDTLPGIGPTTAAKIVAEREANGPFASVDDLGRVSGIGAKKLEDLKGLVVAR